MFDDILGPREEKVELSKGRCIDAASVGGVDSPTGMDPNKKPVPPSIGGLKGRPIGAIPTPGSTPVPSNNNKSIDPDDDPWDTNDLDEDCDCSESDGNCPDDCGGGCQGCLQDNDVWSTNPCAEVELP